MGLLKLAAEGTTQMPLGEALSFSGNGMVVVLIVLVVLAVLVLLISKMVRAAQGKAAEASVDSAAAIGDVPAVPAVPAAPAAAPLPENQSAGTLELYDCTEKEAAVIMAIVSNESGVPLNRLEFKSIKAIEK